MKGLILDQMVCLLEKEKRQRKWPMADYTIRPCYRQVAKSIGIWLVSFKFRKNMANSGDPKIRKDKKIMTTIAKKTTDRAGLE